MISALSLLRMSLWDPHNASTLQNFLIQYLLIPRTVTAKAELGKFQRAHSPSGNYHLVTQWASIRAGKTPIYQVMYAEPYT